MLQVLGVEGSARASSRQLIQTIVELDACGFFSIKESFGVAADDIRTTTTVEWPRQEPTTPTALATTATPSLPNPGIFGLPFAWVLSVRRVFCCAQVTSFGLFFRACTRVNPRGSPLMLAYE